MTRIAGMLVALAAIAWQSTTPKPASFHHLHLNDGEGRLLAYYERLFDPAEIERFTLLGADALRTGNVLVLASSSKEAPVSSQLSAIWHYGWGSVSLGETYLDHNLREVAWEPPLPARGFHLHLESLTPNVAAAWYREYLGADVEFASAVTHTPVRDLRRPLALVRIGGVGMLVYKTEQPLVSTRGKRADHLAFTVPDLAEVLARLRAVDTVVIEPPHQVGEAIVAMIEGPDRTAVELVELRTP